MSAEAKIVFIYIAFWLTWLLFDYASSYQLGVATTALIALSFVGFLAGRLFDRKRAVISQPPHLAHLRLQHLLRFVVALNIALLVPALQSIAEYRFDHRSLMFTDEGVFGSTGLTFFYNYVVQPLNYASVVIAIASRNGPHRYGRYAYVLLAMMALMALGRFPIYFIMYFYLVSKLLEYRRMRISGRGALKVGLVLAIAFSLAWFLLEQKLQEEGAELSDIVTILRVYLLNYHIVGYHMLDYFVYANDSRIVDYTFPTTSLGIVGWALHLISKYSAVLPVFPNDYKGVMEMFNEGLYLPELDWSYNAFTTSILPFYADGGFIGVFFCYGLLGWLSTKGRRLGMHQISPVFLMVTFMLTFSLFQPFVNAELPTSLLLLYLCNQYLCHGLRSRRSWRIVGSPAPSH